MIFKHIFRSYDIRGIYGKDLTEEVMEKIGSAFACLVNECGVGSDARVSSPALKKAFIKGACKIRVTDTGMLPLGVGVFWAWQNKIEYAYITASHLTGEWNGVKFFHSNGIGYSEEENFKIRDLVLSRKFEKNSKNIKKVNSSSIIQSYQEYLLNRISIEQKLSILLDCGNGMATLIAPEMFKRAGFNVNTLFEKLDCRFPNRNPEPSNESLSELKKQVKGYDFGIAYDGDADRMALVDEKGRLLDPVQTSYVILKHLLKNQKGDIVANVETSMLIDKIAKKYNRKVIRIPVGHTFLVRNVLKHNACYGVEASGHYCIPHIVPFDDALAISFYVAYVLSTIDKPVSEIVNELPNLYFKRINFDCLDNKKFDVISSLKERIKESYENVNTMDGVRVDFKHAWVLIRASNTSPIIRMTIEAESEDELKKIENEFTKLLENELRDL